MNNIETPKIAVCFITLNRANLTKDCISKAKERAGLKADYFCLDQGSTDNVLTELAPLVDYVIKKKENVGVASGFNFLWNMAKHLGYDYIASIGNDIELPQNWLKEFYDTHQAIGVTHQYSAIHSVENLPTNVITLNGKSIIKSDTIFGCTFFSTKLLDYVGYFNTDYNPYGLEDGEYNYRCQKSGVTCYYLPIGTAPHIGVPYGIYDDGDYRRKKDESLKKNKEIFDNSIHQMNLNGNYFKPYAQ
jgi:GT2 family glycosyltransferase